MANLPDNWDTKEWWTANYPKQGIYLLARETGLNKHTVRKRLRKHGIKILSKEEAERSKHPCCNAEWLSEHYYVKGLTLQACGQLAGVSGDTIKTWLSALRMQTKCPTWFRCGLSY